MGNDVDSELAVNVKAAKTKRMYFAFVAKGGSDGALVLSKSKVTPVLITDAKKKSGGTKVYQGACFGDGDKLVFEMAQDAPPTMEDTLKKVIHRETGISQHCVCRTGTNPDPGGDGGSVSNQTTTVPPKKTDESGSTAPPNKLQPPQKTQPVRDTSDLAGKYLSLEKEISPQLTKALKEKQGDTEKLKSVFTFAHENAGKKQYDKAIQGLSVLRGLLETGYSTSPTTGSGYDPLVGESEGKPHESTEVGSEDGSSEPKLPYDLAPGDIPKANYTYSTLGGGRTDDSETEDRSRAFEEEEEDSDTEDSDTEDQFTEVQVSPEQKNREQIETLRRSSATAQRQLKDDRIDSEWSKDIDLASYKTKKVLGQGNFGATELLEPRKKGDPALVIKIPLEESGVADLQQEIDFYKKVGDHPNFAKCLGVAKVDGQRGLVLEAVKGKDMGKSMDLLKEKYRSGKLSHEQYWGAVQHTMRQTLQAIAHLESVGVVHNDIRMDNIMCDEETGQMKVLDFGVSVNSGEKVKKAPVGHGTVSPDSYGEKDEKGNRKSTPVDSRHDVFSVGAATYQAGEGQQFDYNSGHGQGVGWKALFAFAEPDEEGKSKQAIRPMEKGAPPKRVAGRSGANTAYTEFVNKLMDPDPSKRMSLTDALKHPFLADSLMDEEQAREVFKSVLATPKTETESEPKDKEYGETEESESDENSGSRDKYTTENYTEKYIYSSEKEEEEEEEEEK